MDIKDSNQNGILIARDSCTDVIVDRKGVQYAVECTELPDDSSLPVYKNMGDLQGLGYTAAKDEETRENLGTYSSSIPAILKYDGKIVPILDKTLVSDENYAEKELTEIEGDSSSLIREAENTDEGITGIIATCLNHGSQEQIFFPFYPVYYAKIAWNCTIKDGDLSEAELMTYDKSTDTFSATGVNIWIDTFKSAQCQFNSAGNSTIFIVKKIDNNVTRGATTLNLFYAIQVVQEGYEITHFSIYEKQEDNLLDCYLLSSSIASPVWSSSAKIQTAILTVDKDNILTVKVPSDWVSDDANASWNYSKVADISKGIPFTAIPIKPRLLDVSNKQWESKEYVSGSTIATYVSV